jgi:hypothetical protein
MLYSTLPPTLKLFATEPAVDDIANHYDFKIISEMETSRGVTWIAQILRKGIIVCRVENHGNGGANHYFRGDDLGVYQIFLDDATRAYPDASEPLDSFVQLIDIVSTR